MGRGQRITEPGSPHHVVARGNRGAAVYADDVDRNRFLRILGSALKRYGIRCDAFCLMTTHYHLLLTPFEENLGDALRLLNGFYAQTFNRRYELKGHLFQNRYRCKVVQTDSHFMATYRYIAINPVVAGICLDPRDWKWSSHAGLFGSAPLPDFVSSEMLLETLGAIDADRAVRELEAFLAAGIAEHRAARELELAAAPMPA